MTESDLATEETLLEELVQLAQRFESTDKEQALFLMQSAHTLRPDRKDIVRLANGYKQALMQRHPDQSKGIDTPYIIWTMRRTGGTSFMALLSDFSNCRSVEHEPFNEDRSFGYIVKRFREGEDVYPELLALLQKRLEIKHCYEIMPEGFNELLYRVSKACGYKHIFLYRRNEVSRLMSLGVAMATGVWGDNQSHLYEPYLTGEQKPPLINEKGMIQRLQSDTERSEAIYAMLENFLPIEFEQLYFTQPSERLGIIESAFSYLGYTGEYNLQLMYRILSCLYESKTPSVAIKPLIGNYQETLNALEAACRRYDFLVD